MPRQAHPAKTAVVRTQLSGQPLFVVAGLPERYLASARQAVERAVRPCRVVSKKFPPTGMLYSPSAVHSLRRSACEFAIQQVAGTESSKLAPCPSRFILAFLADWSDRNLLGAFDFFSWPTRIITDEEAVRAGTADEAEVALAVARACELGFSRTADWMTSVYTGGEHPAQLPPLNFTRRDTEDALVDLFRRARSAEMTADELRAAIPNKPFPLGSLPRVGRPVRAVEDARSRVFVPARQTHGPIRALLEQGADDVSLTMNQIFRFGCPLIEGRHYDVQRTHGAQFNGEPFTCVNQGEVTATGPYVNVYPNDAIRAGSGASVTKVKNGEPPGRL